MKRKTTTLHKACRIGDIKEVKEELAQLSVDYANESSRKKVLSRLDNYGLTALHYAVKYYHLEVVQLLVENGADIEFADKEGDRPIHYAAFYTREPDVSILQYLLSKGANINARNKKELSTLQYACSKGKIHAVEKLINNPGIVVSGYPKTPLQYACNSGSMEIVDMLIKNKQDMLETDFCEFISLQIACSRGNEKLLNYLLDHVEKTYGSDKLASVLEEKDFGKGLLHVAVLSSHLNITKNLLERGCNVYSTMKGDDTILHIAAVSGNLEMVELLLKYIDVDFIDKKNKAGQTPLHKAVKFGKHKMLKKLLEVGAKVNNPDGDHMMPIMLTASHSSNVKTIQSIMKQNTDIMCIDREDCTVLHVATKENNIGAVKMLLTSDQCIEIISMKDSAGNTALHIACREGFTDIAVVLMEKGADVKSRNNIFKTPLHLAAYYGQDNVVDKIIDIDSSTINDNDNNENAPLHCAAENGKADVIRYLLKSGASANDQNFKGDTPIDIAVKNGHTQAVKALICPGGNTKPPTDTSGLLQYACMYGHREMVELLMNYYDFREIDHHGQNCLDLAVLHRNKETAMAILSHEDWKDALRNKTLDGCSNRIRDLICFMPEAAKVVFDRCIEKENYTPPDDFNDRIILNYEFIDNVYRNKRGQQEETHTFSHLIRFDRKELVFHPLIQAALHKKWQGGVAHLYLIKLILYVCFLTFLTGYILATAPSREPNRSNHCIIVREDATWEMKLFVLFGKYMILLLAIVHLIFEVYQIIQQGQEYLQFVNLLEWTVYVMSITNVIGDLVVQPYTQNGSICGLYQKSFGASALFLAWFNFFLFIRKMPVFGIFIVMFIFVFKTFFKFFIVFVLFIAAFGFSFFVLLQNTDLDGFKNPWVAVVKVGVMMTGELNFDDLFFNSGENSSDPLLWIIFILLVLVLNIILMNLLVGLAVGDIEKVRKQAEVTKSIMMMNICLDAQKTVANSRFRKLFVLFYQDIFVKLGLPKNISEDTFAQIKEILMRRETEPTAQPEDNSATREANIDSLEERVDSIDKKLVAIEGLSERVDNIDEKLADVADIKAMIKDIWDVQPRVAWKRSNKLPTIGSKKEETAKTRDKKLEESENMGDNEIDSAKGGSKIKGVNDA